MNICINPTEMGKLIDRVAMAINTKFEMAHFEVKHCMSASSGMLPNKLNTGVYITDGNKVFTGNVWYHPVGGLEVVAISFKDTGVTL